ncbi:MULTISPECIES: cellulose binding domain-containing protein [Actinoplanes]|uniref:cellulose binding domain-containing protein n=1 Tax=Actinoplanes TaxID=1865 RepID=UPI0005F2D6C0|nr:MULTISPECIES: cellulose binding domain-containing protein [Actinoplanes]
MRRFFTLAAGLSAALLGPAVPALAAEPASCHVGYLTYGDAVSFTGQVTITNTGTVILYGWTLRFALPVAQTFRNGWEATFTVDGQNVTGTSYEYNAKVEPGRSVQVGFNATGDVKGPRPAEFRINDSLCTTS